MLLDTKEGFGAEKEHETGKSPSEIVLGQLEGHFPSHVGTQEAAECQGRCDPHGKVSTSIMGPYTDHGRKRHGTEARCQSLIVGHVGR
eukprot:scaffold2422_cov56-Attheya_sp.AAC.9